MHSQVFNSAVIVLAFWWAVFAIMGLFQEKIDYHFALRSGISVLLMCLLGVIIGVTSVLAWLVLDRRTKRALLQEDNVRGLKCSIGEVPMNAKEPPRAENLPAFTALPDVPPDFYPLWLAHYQSSHPNHVALVEAMLKIYENSKLVPATHVQGGHGGRTLLQHSLLVAYQMQQIAMRWSYSGLRAKDGKKVLLRLRDESYKFDPMDPLVVITGLAHDIGKIEAFIYENGVLVGSRHEHDLTGARMLARLPEIWDLPDTDRQAVLLAIAHYHHPMELPLSPDLRAIDDRTIALMELLIKADFTASAIERKNVVPSEDDYEREMDARQNSEITDESIWEAFLELIQETGRINSPDLNYNLGTICQVRGQNSMRLVLHETSLRGALVRRLGMSETPQRGDGRYELTIKLLQMLDEHKVLVKSIQDMAYNADSAIWQMGWYGKKASGSKGSVDRISGWPAAIIVLPSVSPYIETLSSYHWVGQVERGTMGKARSKKVDLEKGQQGEVHDAGSAQPDVPAEPQDDPAPHQTPQEADQTPAGTSMPGRWEPMDEPDIYAVQHSQDPDLVEYDQTMPAKSHASFAGARKGRDAEQPARSRRPRDTIKVDMDALSQAAAMMPKAQVTARIDEEPAAAAAAKSHKVEPTLVEPLNQFGHFIVPAAMQQPQKRIERVSPYSLKKAASKVITLESVATTETGSGTLVYLVPRLLLIKHVPEVNWSEISSDIVNLCKSDRAKGIETIESSGELYLLVDAMMIKSFIERESRPEDSA